MLTQQVNSNGVGHQYQQSIRTSGDATVGPSLQRAIDGGLQYDSASFPILSGGGSGGGSNRFSGLSMPQQQQQQQQQQHVREEDFTIQNEDFPALPGSHVDRNSQKHEISTMMGNMMVGGQLQVPQGADRVRELSQENLQHHLHEQQQQQQQQPTTAQNQAQGSAVSRGNSAPQQASSLGVSSGTVESSAQGGNNSLANGSFLGIGVGGAIQGHLGGNGLVSTVGGTGAAGLAGVSQSKEGGYGLAGLLDVIRMTDKVTCFTMPACLPTAAGLI